MKIRRHGTGCGVGPTFASAGTPRRRPGVGEPRLAPGGSWLARSCVPPDTERTPTSQIGSAPEVMDQFDPALRQRLIGDLIVVGAQSLTDQSQECRCVPHGVDGEPPIVAVQVRTEYAQGLVLLFA